MTVAFCQWNQPFQMFLFTLRKKTEPKQCPLGTVLKNGALFSKKGTKTVPLWQSAPHQKGTIFQNSALGAPFSQKRLKMVPSWNFCMEKIGRIGALLHKGTKIFTDRQTVPLGHHFSTVYFSQWSYMVDKNCYQVKISPNPYTSTKVLVWALLTIDSVNFRDFVMWEMWVTNFSYKWKFQMPKIGNLIWYRTT